MRHHFGLIVSLTIKVQVTTATDDIHIYFFIVFAAPALAGQYRHAVICLFVRSSTIYSGCLVSATPTVLANHFDTSQMFKP